MSRQARLALLDLSTFRPETAAHTNENGDAWSLVAPCRRELYSDRHRVGQRERRWETAPVWIRQYFVGYRKVSGRKLLDELRATLRDCRTYRLSNGETSTVVRWAPAGAPKSADLVTWCERRKADTGIYHQCTLTRGHYVMEIDGNGGEGDLAKFQAMLTKLHPLMAAALVEAVEKWSSTRSQNPSCEPGGEQPLATPAGPLCRRPSGRDVRDVRPGYRRGRVHPRVRRGPGPHGIAAIA
ncbi:hypothetical protein ACFT9M_00755 [Micromonospora purpureochromogenes]|uniref:hypothetical protein n=1 Tax=Micromonospora purpureochromogenes TaxID=47872 RepID=UPI0036385149